MVIAAIGAFDRAASKQKEIAYEAKIVCLVVEFPVGRDGDESVLRSIKVRRRDDDA